MTVVKIVKKNIKYNAQYTTGYSRMGQVHQQTGPPKRVSAITGTGHYGLHAITVPKQKVSKPRRNLKLCC